MRRALTALVLQALLASCAMSFDAGADASGADAARTDACVRTTCAALAAECGAIDDGCGGALACGDCAPGLRCGAVEPNRCAQCAGDADCTGDEVCDLGAGRCTTGCRTGSRVVIDIPARRLPLEVTLAGGALPASGVFQVRLVLEPTDPPMASAAAEVELYERLPGGGSAPRSDLAVSLAEGSYRVWLQPSDDDGSFPRGDVPVTTLEVTPETDRVTIDIPRVRQRVRATLASAPLPPGSSPAAAAFLRFLPTGEAARSRGFSLPLYDEEGPRAEEDLWILPGTYDVVLDANGASGLPLATNVTLARAVELRGGEVSIDIPRAPLELTVTLDGAPPPGGRGPELWLRPVGSTSELEWTRLTIEEDGVIEAYVLPGRYEVRYARDRVTLESGWPITDGPLGELVVDAGGATRSLDVPRVPVELRARFDALVDVEASCRGRLHLGSAAFRVGEPTDPPVRFFALPGRYPVVFRAPSLGDCVPSALRVAGDGARLGEVVLDGGEPLDVIVPVHRVTLRAEVDGIDLTPPELGEWEHPPRWRVGATGGEPFQAGVSVPLEGVGWLVEHPLTITYVAPSAGRPLGDWPMTSGVVFEGVVASDGELVFDMARRRVDVDITLGGRPLPDLRDEAVYPWDFPSFAAQLWLTNSGHPWLDGTPWRLHDDESAPIARRGWWILPGRYTIAYAKPTGWAINAEGSFPPPPIHLGCWIVD